MKRRIYFAIVILSVFYLLPCAVYAQKSLIVSAVNSGIFKQQVPEKRDIVNFIESKSKTGSVSIFEFDSSILDSSIFILNIFPGESLTVMKDDIDRRSRNDFSLYGHIQGAASKEGSVVLTYLNGELSGNINYKFKNFAINPMGKGRIAVYEIDFKKYPEDDARSLINRDTKSSKNTSSQNATASSNGFDAPVPCRIRVLVAYTPSAESNIKNTLGYSTMVQFVNQAIAETNQAYLNSNVNYRVELASATRVNYTESGDYDTDLNRFESTNDGYMDEINGYRNSFSADVCVLIFNNNAYCGLASDIKANAESAFCEVHYSCVLGNYSFAHEIGHLFGCRHNPEADNNTEPFAYGHGYVYGLSNWRTIMAYNINNETRLQYFSNPNITYNGVAMGTADVNNNARVLNENAGAVSTFRSTEFTVSLTGTNSIINDEVGDATANTIVLLEPGFQVLTNSVFRAYIKNCNDLADSRDSYIANANVTANSKADQTSINIFPNPTKGIVRVAGDGKGIENAKIIVHDQLGREVYKSLNKSGNNMQLDLSYLNSGVYYLKIITSGKTTSTKIIIMK